MSNSKDQADSEEQGVDDALELDASGLFCPSTSRDVPKFCHFLGHELLESIEKDGSFVYLIRKVES